MAVRQVWPLRGDAMLADDDGLYAGLLARDVRFDGVALVCVTSTGIFCRLSCPARKPKRENCQFRATVADCVAAGFRACKRCKPEQARTPDQTFSPGCWVSA